MGGAPGTRSCTRFTSGNRIIKVHLAGIQQLAKHDTSEHLRNRSDAINRIAVDMNLFLDVGVAVAFGPDQLLAGNDAYSQAIDPLSCECFRDESVDFREPRLKVLCGGRLN